MAAPSATARAAIMPPSPIPTATTRSQHEALAQRCGRRLDARGPGVEAPRVAREPPLSPVPGKSKRTAACPACASAPARAAGCVRPELVPAEWRADHDADARALARRQVQHREQRAVSVVM